MVAGEEGQWRDRHCAVELLDLTVIMTIPRLNLPRHDFYDPFLRYGTYVSPAAPGREMFSDTKKSLGFLYSQKEGTSSSESICSRLVEDIDGLRWRLVTEGPNKMEQSMDVPQTRTVYPTDGRETLSEREGKGAL